MEIRTDADAKAEPGATSSNGSKEGAGPPLFPANGDAVTELLGITATLIEERKRIRRLLQNLSKASRSAQAVAPAADGKRSRVEAGGGEVISRVSVEPPVSVASRRESGGASVGDTTVPA
jgi:hypothetical protein